MNKTNARKIAETITNEQLARMFEKAKTGIINWEATSVVNSGLTKGTAWNILYKCFNPDEQLSVCAKTNIVREFGEFIQDEFEIPKKRKKSSITPHHQDPDFNLGDVVEALI